ncbi:LysE family translocator [Gymnodinialimonas sp. 2305UL16-5]|uniref:LysE family translocator n=1 Tax=Gymnodinialimonas mytili TaxID=3126503 RepID=UPI00309683E4
MENVNIVIVLSAALIGGLSPGPGTVAIAGTAMARGRSMGLAVAWGITSASTIWAVAAALGFGALLQAKATLFEVLKYIGTGYLTWLAWRSARSALFDKAIVPVDVGASRLLAAWLKGLGTHLTNPKAVIYWGSILAIGVKPGGGTEVVAWVLVLSLLVNVTLTTSYALILSSQAAMAVYGKARRWIEAAAAAVFGAGAFLLFRTREI